MGKLCEITGCDSVASLEVQWSGPSDNMQIGRLCKTHVDELWKKMDPLLASGLGTWVNRPIGTG